MLATIDSFNTDDLSEIECLEMLFYLSSRRQDARMLAEAAIETYGSLGKVFERPGQELRESLGLDRSMTGLLAIAKTSMKLILTEQLPVRQEIPSFAVLMDYLALELRQADQEILRVLYLDIKNKLIKDEEVARGTVNAVYIYPKELAKRAAAFCASSIILAHNHLSDDPTPSQLDIKTTRKTKAVLESFDIVLHDHVIIARNSCFSMLREQLI
ncbi:MAG: JAB domain-containing protein [Rhizobiaceae bacterium]